jgi:hypothetical protein
VGFHDQFVVRGFQLFECPYPAIIYQLYERIIHSSCGREDAIRKGFKPLFAHERTFRRQTIVVFLMLERYSSAEIGGNHIAARHRDHGGALQQSIPGPPFNPG